MSNKTVYVLADDLLTVAEIAALLRISYFVAWKRSAAGEYGAPMTLGRRSLYRREAVESAAPKPMRKHSRGIGSVAAVA